MPIRMQAVATDGGEIRLMLPAGRTLNRDGWYVTAEAQVGPPALLTLRAWTPDNEGFRVIRIDNRGAEYGSVRAESYKSALAALDSRDGGHVSYPRIEGRRLVSGGDRDWEIAAEVREVVDDELLFVRVWLQALQRVTVYAIDVERRVCGHATADTYRKASDAIVEHLVA